MIIESNELWYENRFLRIINSIQTLVVFRKYHTTKLLVLITKKAKAINVSMLISHSIDCLLQIITDNKISSTFSFYRASVRRLRVQLF